MTNENRPVLDGPAIIELARRLHYIVISGSTKQTEEGTDGKLNTGNIEP
jgi:hypothetical protein